MIEYGGSTPDRNFFTPNPSSMATPTAVGTGESGMINLVKSPFDKITVLLVVQLSTWVLQLCTMRVTQNESNAKFRTRMVPPIIKGSAEWCYIPLQL